MTTDALIRNRWERSLGLFARLRPGEGLAVLYFMSYGFLVMFSYYMLKTLREPLLLSKATAETKSYAYAVIALVLLFVVPAYGALYRRLPKRQLSLWVSAILLAVQGVFFLLSLAGLRIGFAYYVWVGIFGVLITAQFWAFAADSFNLKAGKRLFPLIMIGVSLGGLAGPAIAGQLFQLLGARDLMLVILVFIALTLPMSGLARGAVPALSRSFLAVAEPVKSPLLGGFSLVRRNRYLLLIAMMIVLLNWVNTTGEYLLAELVIRHADSLIARDPSLDKGNLIAAFYGNFFSIVNALSLFLQLFIVSRVIRWIGVRGAVLVLPVIALVGYGLMVFMPIFSMIRMVKMAENSTDYSLMNTARHALFLPLSAAEKYQSKIAIDAFFWRFGDLVQALAVYAGLHLFGFQSQQFAVLNMVLALVWLALAVQIGRRYVDLEQGATSGEPPRLLLALRPHPAPPGVALAYRLPANLFHCEPGDILRVSVREVDADALPAWLHFDAESLAFTGVPPEDTDANTWLTVRASNLEGQWVETRLGFIHL
ncbi:MAG: putative Ig domain-containing protein [Gammaproteobacteria bacterium]|nr:putative Ig domain-containing protein [Gammaproteobacteria bacterium]MDH5172643.1 putative Ig domain-containing protein [Gammaproteobacteria bacterium]